MVKTISVSVVNKIQEPPLHASILKRINDMTDRNTTPLRKTTFNVSRQNQCVQAPESIQSFLSRMRRVLHQEITDGKIIDITLKKCTYCIFRGIDDRLFVHIETG